ncbi:DUF4221 family protein [Algoriphagus hitonicola]|uniref:DUF4221 family protein n=1 Tax=Algoriphagus hitonicola TaxID=435880 RepID=UPI0015A52EBE|nr:DUF4221 family protein [Algoriphagus hitonicola]
MDNLKVLETIQLEKEGPNGVGGGFINRLQVLENGNLLLFNFNKISEIDSKGNLIKNHEFNKETIKGYEWEETDALDNYGRFSPDGKLFMTRLIDEDYQKPSKGLAIIEVESGMMKAIKTDAFSKLDQYRISMVSEGGRSSMFAGESVFMDFDGDHFIVSNSAINEVYYYDFKSDTLFHKKFESSLTANERVINYPQTTETPEEFQKVMRQKMEQVQFARLTPQPKENLFWRFTRDQDRKIADSVVYKDVLTFFDSDYKMIHEEKVDQVPNSRISFFKDGMLYSFVNIDDELAFIRTKATISKN